MADDIVTRLRNRAYELEEYYADLYLAADEIERLRDERDDWQTAYHKAFDELGQAVDEIERLRAAFALAVGELSTHGEYTAWTPEVLMNQFLEEARRG